MNEHNFCTQCGAPLPPNATNCIHCGYPVIKDKSTKYIIIIVILVILNLFLLLINATSNSSADSSDSSSINESIADEPSNNEVIITQKQVDDSSQVVPETQIDIGNISDQEIYSGHNTTISAKRIYHDGENVNVAVYIENTSKLSLSFDARAYGVNGIMIGSSVYNNSMRADVAPNSKTNAIISIDANFLKDYDIKNIRYIDVLFWAYDNDKSYKEFDTGQIRIKTSLFDKKSDKIESKNIYDNNGIKVDYLKSEGNTHYYVIANNTSDYFSFSLADININGFTMTDSYYNYDDTIILKNSKAVLELKIDDDFISLNEIKDISQIDFKLHINPKEKFSNDYNTDIIIDKR